MNGYRANILVRVDVKLSRERLEDIQSSLDSRQGVIGTRMSDKFQHLILVDYDPRVTSAQAIVDGVRTHGVGAQLIGL